MHLWIWHQRCSTVVFSQNSAPVPLFSLERLNGHDDSLKLIMTDEHISCDKAAFTARRRLKYLTPGLTPDLKQSDQ